MENVQFDNTPDMNSYDMNRGSNSSEGGKVTKIFIKLHLAKDQKQANVVMLVFAIICLLFMVYFLINTYAPGTL